VKENTRKKEISKRLDFELFNKSANASPAFILIAIALAYFHLGVEKYTLFLIYCMLGSICSALIRYILSIKALKQKNICSSDRKWMITAILINTISWSLGFSLVFYESKMGTPELFAAGILSSTFVSASILTLAYIPVLAILFQVGLILPLFLFQILPLIRSGNQIGSFLAILIVVQITYCIKQTIALNKQIKSKITDEIELEESLKIITESNKKIAADAIKINQMNRLSALVEMSAGLSHEINNPITVIKGKNTQLLRSANSGQLDSLKIKEYIEVVNNNADRITTIARKLKEFSNSSDNTPYLNASLKEILNEVAIFSLEKFFDQSIELNFQEISEDVQVNCRPPQIVQVLLGLINNSFDAIKNLEEKWVHVNVEVQNKTISISVIDCGHGIPLEIQNKIMEPFFTTKEIGKGAGLGLTSSLGIIQSHGGNFFLDTTSKNTKFVVTLPKL
jgi:signal transduction histidine kinase